MKNVLLLTLLFVPLLVAGQDKTAAPDQKSDKATIVFFREHHFAGSALKPSVYLDGKELERLPNGRWFSVEVQPGKHELGSSAKNEPQTVVETSPGGTAYVEMVLVTGNWRGGGRLLAVDADEAKSKIANLKPLHGEEKQDQ